MCIIPGPITSVDKTKLFVLPSVDRTRQMTFYMNSVDTPRENVMILPVPNIDTIDLHTIRYKALFTDLKRSVGRIPTRSMDFGMYRCAAVSSSYVEPLPVFEHGSYLVSIATSIEDLQRLNTEVFELPPDIYSFFSRHYNSEFGYLCCKLKQGDVEYEPMCYSHQLHSNGKLFVPTLHYHNHNGRIDTAHADWDHMIYSVGTTKDANLEYYSQNENKVRWRSFPEAFRFDATAPVRCASLSGDQANRDIAFALEVTV
jgi:hypothetical protein